MVLRCIVSGVGFLIVSRRELGLSLGVLGVVTHGDCLYGW